MEDELREKICKLLDSGLCIAEIADQILVFLEKKLQQMALNYDVICKETDAISYTRGVLEGRKQERERIIDKVENLIIGGRLGKPEQEGEDVYFLEAKGWQALRRENNEH